MTMTSGRRLWYLKRADMHVSQVASRFLDAKRQTILIVITLMLAGIACTSDENQIVAGRPPDAEIVASFKYGSGKLGGGATATIYVSEATFDEVAAGYRTVSQRLSGREGLSGEDGVRFDAGGDCLRVSPWHHDADLVQFRGVLNADQSALLSRSNAFFETQPLDCQYDG